jgi:O-acetyl-ADP-ribose deacetylase
MNVVVRCPCIFLSCSICFDYHAHYMISLYSFAHLSLHRRIDPIWLNWNCCTATTITAAIDLLYKNFRHLTSVAWLTKSRTKKSSNRVMLNYSVLATYDRTTDFLPTVILVHGSVLEFTTKYKNDTNVVGCVVNAANEICLGGGGIDGAITDAGGPTLAEDRLSLPVVINNEINTKISSKRKGDDSGNILSQQNIESIRCRTGSAVITGPGNYGKLYVPYVIHAVGPNFYKFLKSNQEELDAAYNLLRSSYHTSLDIASSTSNPITNIAFCIISAGAFRGRQPLERIIQCGLMAIHDWRPSSSSTSSMNTRATTLQPPAIGSGETSHHTTNTGSCTNYDKNLTEIYIFAYTDLECELLQRLGKLIFAPDEV